MAMTLTLVQTDPIVNPSRNICKIGLTGSYVNGTGEPLPLTAIQDPGAIGQVPMNSPATNPPPVTPYLLNDWMGGYYAEIQRVVAAGQTTFYLRIYQPGGTELANGLYSATSQIAASEIFIEILVPLATQA